MFIEESGMSRHVPEAYEQCRIITKRAAKIFYWGSLFLPQRKRLATWALYAFCRTIDDAVDNATDISIARGALEEWRERLNNIYAGHPTDIISLAWVDMLQHFDVPMQPAIDLIDGVQMDLDRVRPSTFDELRLYCYRVAGTVGLLSSPILGYRSVDALPHAVELGIGMQLTNIIRDIGEDARNDRIYLPQEELQRFNYSEQELMDGVINDNFIALMQFQIKRAHGYYQRARPGIDMLDPGARLAIYTISGLYRDIMNAVEKNKYDVFTKRAYVPFSTKLITMPKLWMGMKSHSLVFSLPDSESIGVTALPNEIDR